MATTASFKSFSLTRLSIKAPAQRPNEAPSAVTSACGQCTSLEKTKITTAEALIMPARMLLRRARAADRQTHHGQRGHHQKSDAAAEIVAIDGDEKLQRARTPGRQMRFAGRRSLAKETAPGE